MQTVIFLHEIVSGPHEYLLGQRNLIGCHETSNGHFELAVIISPARMKSAADLFQNQPENTGWLIGVNIASDAFATC